MKTIFIYMELNYYIKKLVFVRTDYVLLYRKPQITLIVAGHPFIQVPFLCCSTDTLLNLNLWWIPQNMFKTWMLKNINFRRPTEHHTFAKSIRKVSIKVLMVLTFTLYFYMHFVSCTHEMNSLNVFKRYDQV